MQSDIGTYVSGTAGTTGREPFEDTTGGTNTIPSGTHEHAPRGGYEGGLGAAGVVGEGHHHHHHHHHAGGGENLGSTGQVYGQNAGDQYNAGGIDARNVGTVGSNEPFVNRPSENPTNEFGTGRNETDRVGHLDQNLSQYERTGEHGPSTTGAAGTDRFDTDRIGRHGTGGIATGEPGASAQQQTDSQAKAASILTTSDTEFANRKPGSNIGSKFDAYRDDNAAFQNNTSGPDGRTALTGREGTTEKNPVAQAKSHETGADTTTTHEGEKPGLIQKIKDML
ncbi:hypothetical protein Q5752_003272 [Cryptotrichosporon argae]